MARFSVSIPLTDKEQLEAIADGSGLSRPYLVELAVKDLLEKSKGEIVIKIRPPKRPR